MAADYKPVLPVGMEMPKGASINTDHADYKALTAVATRHGLSQAAFSDALGLEFQRHERAHAVTRAAAPPPVAKPDFSKMSTRDKFAHALNNPKRG
jgi:hypothetical protein